MPVDLSQLCGVRFGREVAPVAEAGLRDRARDRGHGKARRYERSMKTESIDSLNGVIALKTIGE